MTTTIAQAKSIYLSAANQRGLCPTCGRANHSPYRTYDSRGKVTAGCVDEFHTGHLIPISESNFWHNRKEAKKIRADLFRKLAAL